MPIIARKATKMRSFAMATVTHLYSICCQPATRTRNS